MKPNNENKIPEFNDGYEYNYDITKKKGVIVHNKIPKGFRTANDIFDELQEFDDNVASDGTHWGSEWLEKSIYDKRVLKLLNYLTDCITRNIEVDIDQVIYITNGGMDDE